MSGVTHEFPHQETLQRTRRLGAGLNQLQFHIKLFKDLQSIQNWSCWHCWHCWQGHCYCRNAPRRENCWMDQSIASATASSKGLCLGHQMFTHARNGSTIVEVEFQLVAKKRWTNCLHIPTSSQQPQSRRATAQVTCWCKRAHALCRRTSCLSPEIALQKWQTDYLMTLGLSTRQPKFNSKPLHIFSWP